MKISLRALELDLKNFKPYSEKDRFGEVMSSFFEQAKAQYSLLEEMQKKMETLYTEVAKYFAFDSKKYTMEECFGDIKQFKDQYIQACDENLKRRELEEKNRRAKEAKEKAEKERKERLSNKIDPTNSDNQMDQGLMEQLINSLHTGSAFAQHKRKRTKAVTPQGKFSESLKIYTKLTAILFFVDRRQQLSRSRSRAQIDQRAMQSAMFNANY